jgi:hypothetical protein
MTEKLRENKMKKTRQNFEISAVSLCKRYLVRIIVRRYLISSRLTKSE